MRPIAALLILFCLAAPSAAQDLPPRTVVVLLDDSLYDGPGRELAPAEVFSALALVGREGEWLKVETSPGNLAWLPVQAAAILPGPPSAHRERLARLGRAPLDAATARRLAQGLIQEGDSQWLVEMAWGRPWRSFMVNRFQDEEHYVYQGDSARPILLRFKGGRLIHPFPAQLESPPPPR